MRIQITQEGIQIFSSPPKLGVLIVPFLKFYKVKKLVAIWLQEIQNDFDLMTDRDIASIRSGKILY